MRVSCAAVSVLPLLLVGAAANAACPDWRPEARIILRDPPKVTLGGGMLEGIKVEFALTSPISYNTSVVLDAEVWSRVEVLDGEGKPVTFLRPPMVTHGATPRYELATRRGERGRLTFRPDFVDLPGGGTYRMRIGFFYWDYPAVKPPGKKLLAPKCEHWSEWTTFDLHPVDSVGSPYGAIAGPFASKAVLHGVLWVDVSVGEVSWVVVDAATAKVTRVKLGRTTEDPRAGGAADFGFKDLDARLDTSGVVHVVYAAPDGKTAYHRFGPKGALLESKTFAGKKKLAGPPSAITVVDKGPPTHP